MNCHRLVVLLNGPLRFAVNSSFVQDLHVACVNRKHKGDSLGIHVRSVCVCVRACQCSEDTHHLCNRRDCMETSSASRPLKMAGRYSFCLAEKLLDARLK